jgi:hypothetical protein
LSPIAASAKIRNGISTELSRKLLPKVHDHAHIVLDQRDGREGFRYLGKAKSVKSGASRLQ